MALLHIVVTDFEHVEYCFAFEKKVKCKLVDNRYGFVNGQQ